MREIKFRGLWDDGTGILQWVYGYFHKDHDTDIHLIQDLSYMSGSAIIRNPETIGQYTGLKDKNGKEIYEGDILYHKLQGKRVVYYPFNERVASYGLREISSGFCSTLQDSHRVYELIGNIHENPELLEH